MAFFKLPFQRPLSPEEHYRNASTLEAWAQRYAARAYNSVEQVLPAGVSTVIGYNTIVFSDRASVFTLSGGSIGTYTCPADGLYHVHARLSSGDGLGSRSTFSIFRNGGENTRGTDSPANGGSNFTSWQVTGLVDARRNDTLTIRMLNLNAGTITIETGAALSFVDIYRVGPHPDDQFR